MHHNSAIIIYQTKLISIISIKINNRSFLFLPGNGHSGVIYSMKTPQDITIEQLEDEIQSLKLQKISDNDERMEIVKNLMNEIKELKKNLSVVESILRSSLPVLDTDKYVD